MKRVLSILSVLVAVLSVVSCNKRVVIPDDTLSDIFHDAFIVNAYIDRESPDTDTLRIYEPIFQRYGYTAEDVRYTIGNFSRRKSARLGSVVEKAIERLGTEAAHYERLVVILDTIRDVAIRTYTRTIYEDTLIQARRRADSTLLRIVIEPVEKGSYDITYKAECEDDLEKYPRRAEFYFEDVDSVRNGVAIISIRPNLNGKRTLVSHNERNRRLVLELGNYTGDVRPKRQSLDIRDLKVVYRPEEDMAIDSLYQHYLPIKVFVDGFLVKKDSLTLSADTTRVATPTSDND